MKTKLICFLTFVFLVIAPTTFAQEKTITGTVTDDSGLPLPGVNITVEGTTTGTSTDFDGNYSVKAAQGQVLHFNSVGFEEATRTVGSSETIDVILTQGTALSEVVVTALGISRDEKALGYSTQSVSGDELTASRVSNPLDALSGNVAGVQITTPSSNLGGSTRILLRGVTSLTGENKPLIVIDGIPMANDNFNTTDAQRGGGGRDFGDTGIDINPDDIEDINVLKGGPAAALYGSRGANGVIMITTKKAKEGKTSVTLNSGFTIGEVARIPRLQKKYGGGSGEFDQVTINGTEYNVDAFGVDESWGPKYDPDRLVLQWNNFDKEAYPEDYLNPQPWVYPKNDMESTLFRNSLKTTNGVSISQSKGNTSARISFSNMKQHGILPNTRLRKNTLNLSLTSKVGDKLTASGDITYVRTDGFNRPAVGYGDNSVIQKAFQWSQRQLDYKKMQDYKLPDGSQRTWNRTSVSNPSPQFSDNPYWTLYENTAKDKRNRFYGNAKLRYDILPGLYAVGTVYGDHYDYNVRSHVAVGSAAQSEFTMDEHAFTEMNYEGRIHYDKDFSDFVSDGFFRDFSINTFLGANRMHRTRREMSANTNGGLVVPNIYNLGNSSEKPDVSNEDKRKEINSIFGEVSLGWKGLAFIDFTGRNDWSSTLPKGDNSYFYPSLNGSFVFSELLHQTDWLTYAKIRGGYSQVRNDTDPYQLINTFEASPLGGNFLGNPAFVNSTTKQNADLKPEKVSTWEIGLEGALFDNRISFDLSYYDKQTDELIMPVEIDPATGFSSTFKNAGKMSNKGFEALVTLVPIRNNDFEWDLTWNFAKNNNKIVSLFGDLDGLQLVNAPFNVTLNAMLGEEYGQIRGTDFVYDDEGNKVVDANGKYESTPVKNLGSVLPDYNMGIRNTFTYKHFSLSALIDVQQGGKYFSTTNLWDHYTGFHKETATGTIREDGLVPDAVTGDVSFESDGSYTVTNTSPNETNVSAHSYYTQWYTGPDARNVFDASYVKLREVTLTYDFPKDWIGPLAGLQLSAFGRNLAAWGLDNRDFDPEMSTTGSGNIQGIEGGSLPPTRSYGMNLKIQF